MVQRLFSLYISVFFILLVGCSQSSTTDDSSNNVSDPDNDVAANVGTAAQIITEDILDQINDVLGDIDDQIEDNAGSVTQEDASFVILYDVTDEDVIFDVTVSASSSCSDGGSVEHSGELEYNVNTATSSGTISGNFTLSLIHI
mgnify:FL=1